MRRVAVDFDGVILPFGALTDSSIPPYDGVGSALETLKNRGYEIIILTSRLSETWWKDDYQKFGASDPFNFGIAQTKYVQDYLRYWAIPFDRITAEKVPCSAYFDDMAVTISEDYGLIDAVSEWLSKR